MEVVKDVAYNRNKDSTPPLYLDSKQAYMTQSLTEQSHGFLKEPEYNQNQRAFTP